MALRPETEGQASLGLGAKKQVHSTQFFGTKPARRGNGAQKPKKILK